MHKEIGQKGSYEVARDSHCRFQVTAHETSSMELEQGKPFLLRNQIQVGRKWDGKDLAGFGHYFDVHIGLYGKCLGANDLPERESDHWLQSRKESQLYSRVCTVLYRIEYFTLIQREQTNLEILYQL